MYAKFSAHALQYTRGYFKSFKLFTYITTSHVGDGSWSDTTEIFILNLQDQIQQYDTLVDISDPLSAVKNRTFFDNVVEPIPK